MSEPIKEPRCQHIYRQMIDGDHIRCGWPEYDCVHSAGHHLRHDYVAAEESALRDLVERVHSIPNYEDTVCVRHWLSSTGPSFFEVGRYVKGTVTFVPITPLWSMREKAWLDAVERLGA